MGNELELRQSDPTLKKLDGTDPILVELSDPPTAHRMGCWCKFVWGYHELDATYAKWICVPCRTCFPDAPNPGFEWMCSDCGVEGCPGQYAQSFLAWQVAE